MHLPIKPKNTKFAKYHYRPEAVLDAIVHNPHMEKTWWKQLQKGNYYRFYAKFIASALQRIFKFRFKDNSYHFIGVSHLDAVWHWTVLDTKMRVIRTFLMAVENCRRFPFLTITFTSPQYFLWIKQYSPKLWKEVKQLVQKGQIELTGGMWIEPDLDMLWGESLVRQRLYGMLFYQREFNKVPNIESLLDDFGFPWSLPQILQQSEAENFWTTKCSWNDTNYWPLANYTWQGIDGSQVFTHHFQYNWYSFSHLKKFPWASRLTKEEANGTELSSHSSNQAIENTKSQDRLQDIPFFFGFGDGGKGPMQVEVGLIQLLVQLGIGKFSSMSKAYQILKQKAGNRLVVWNDEMYLETHRGTKSSQMEIKHLNRRTELWIACAERLHTIMNVLHPGLFSFDKKEQFEEWRSLMFNQFHDILPGSSIPDVYELAFKELRNTIANAQSRIAMMLNAISHDPSEILIYNPYNWSYTGYIPYNDKMLYVDQVPGLSIQKMQLNAIEEPVNRDQTITETPTSIILENGFLKAQISKENGSLFSLFSKTLQKELLDIALSAGSKGAGLRVFHDHNKIYPECNIQRNYAQQPIAVNLLEPPEIITVKGDYPYASFKFGYLNSTVEFQYSLYPKDEMLHVRITVDNHNKQILMKWFLPLAFKSEEITSEIPYASIARKRVKHSEMETAKWEMNMQKWMDISDPEGGLAILNNNRYGYSSTRRGVYLTLTRTPHYCVSPFHGSHQFLPHQPLWTDLKSFSFEFGLVPHKGSWKEALIWQKGYEFNQLPIVAPMLNTLDTNNTENLPQLSSKLIPENVPALDEPFFTIDSPQILVGAIKPTEWQGSNYDQLVNESDWQWDEQTIIIRLIDQGGKDLSCNLQFNSAITVELVEAVNLLERNASDSFAIENNAITLNFRRFEIKTLRVKFTKNE